MQRSFVQGLAILGLWSACTSATHAQSCEPEWSDAFIHADVNGEVLALAKFDDGTGESLYLGGSFNDAGGVAAQGIARWDGERYHAVGQPFEGFGYIRALIVFDDGTGPALYMGGRFTIPGNPAMHNIARWAGRSWTSLGAGISADANWEGVYSMHVHDDGPGPALFVGGWFETAGDTLVHHVARWDGQSWSALDEGLTPWPTQNYICALDIETFDDGNGPALYVGGTFLDASGSGARHFAKWDGRAWSDPGLNLNGTVAALAVYDDGSGPALHLAGSFLAHLLAWNGDAAHQLPGFEKVWLPYFVCMAVHDDGSGSGLELYVGGGFDEPAGVVNAHSIAKWNGSSWSALGGGLGNEGGYGPTVDVMLSAGAQLIVGGFLDPPGLDSENIARWTGSEWSGLLSEQPHFAGSRAAYFADAAGVARLHAFGTLSGDGITQTGLFRKDDRHWTLIGEFNDGAAYVLKVLPEPVTGANNLFVGGNFEAINGITVNRVARWDGMQWHALGSGITDPPNSFHRVLDFVAADTGQGPSVFVCGNFNRILTSNGTEFTPPVARWDGRQWHLARQGFVAWPYGGPIESLEVLTDLDGTQSVVAGGELAFPGQGAYRPFGIWNGSAWSMLPYTIGAHSLEYPTDLELYATGCGTRLFAVCQARSSTSDTQRHVIMWTGSNWISKGVINPPAAPLLCAFDDGKSNLLALAGNFLQIDGVASQGLATFDGWRWTAMTPGFFGGSGVGMTSIDSAEIEGQTELAFGGYFTSAGGVPSRNFAILRTCPTAAAPNPADVDGSGCVNIDDLLMLISAWGPCASPCAADIDGDGLVNGADLTLLLAGWG